MESVHEMSSATSPIEPLRIAVAMLVVWCLVAGGLFTLASVWPVVQDLWLAQAIGVVSIAIAGGALWPLVVARRAMQSQEGGAVLAAMMVSLAVRSSLTILFVILMSNWGTAPRQTVGLWTIFWYATLLATEVIVVARSLIAFNRIQSP